MSKKLQVVAGIDVEGRQRPRLRQGFRGVAPQEITRAVITWLADQPDTGKDIYIQDSEVPGFKLRRDRRGRITFMFVGRIRGGVGDAQNKLKNKTLGLARGKGALTIAAARARAVSLREQLGDGVDPDREKRAKIEALAAVERARTEQDEIRKWTPAFALEHLLDWRASRPRPEDRLRPETVKYYRRAIGYLPDIAHVPIVDLRAVTIREALDKVDGAAKPAKARRALSAVINHTIKRLELNIPNPVSRLDRGEFKAPQPRTSYIRESQIGEFIDQIAGLTILGKERNAKRARDYLMLTLLYGTRKFELMRMQWDWINWKTDCLTIPAEHRKNAEAHTLPLTNWTRAILKRRESEKSSHDFYVFPGNRKGKPLADVRASLTKAVGADFKLHDARRTLVTHCAALGISGTRLKALIGHARDSVTEFYDQREIEQMRRDFTTYHDWLHDQWKDYSYYKHREVDPEEEEQDAREQAAYEAWLAAQPAPPPEFPGL